MSYLARLAEAQHRNNSWLCLGLDPAPEKLPLPAVWKWDEPVLPFNKAIVDATADLVCAYKPNLGFYLQWGAAGIIALERTIAYIPDDIPVVVDCKTGDIGYTQAAWARGLFDEWGADAVTVNPYVGRDAIVPMLAERPDKAVYVLVRTSNENARSFQGSLADRDSLSRRVIEESERWPVAGHLGFVVGSTWPEELRAARQLSARANFLIPGVGAQGGSLEAAVRYGADAQAGPLISTSRSILYASAGIDFAVSARAAAKSLRQRINDLRANP